MDEEEAAQEQRIFWKVLYIDSARYVSDLFGNMTTGLTSPCGAVNRALTALDVRVDAHRLQTPHASRSPRHHTFSDGAGM